MKRITGADALLLALVRVAHSDRFDRGSELAEVLNRAAEEYVVFQSFKWNPDYEASKKLNEALNLLDLTGMIVGDNMPTRFFRLTNQAKGYTARLADGLDEATEKAVNFVAAELGKTIAKTQTDSAC